MFEPLEDALEGEAHAVSAGRARARGGKRPQASARTAARTTASRGSAG